VQRGLTLIELMISIAIGLVVVGAVTYMYVGSKGAYRGNESAARIQEAGRFALDSITRDIRRTGALGCGSLASIATAAAVNVSVIPTNTTTGTDPTRLLVNGVSGQPIPIQGFAPASYAVLPAAPPAGWVAPGGVTYWGGDVLQLQVGSGLPARVQAGPDTAAATITVADNTLPNSAALNFNPNDYALLADCSSAAIFQVGPTAAVGGTAYTLSYRTPGGVIPPLPPISVNTYPTVQHFDQVTYFLGQVPNSASATIPAGLSALYRYSMVTGLAEEVASNVEDFDVVYGVDTTGAGVAGTFVHAAAVPDWSKVVSVRVSILAVGDQLGSAAPAAQYALRGPDNGLPAQQATPDTRARQVFTATAVLRDRLQ
jgi:type IV pilus assembly protein PilW